MSILTPITNFVSRMFRPSAKTEPEKVASPTVTFAKERETPPMEEITTSEIKGISSMLGHADGNPDEVLKKQGISVYDDMVAKDAHIYAVYSTRKLSVALTPWEILPADKSDRSQQIAEFVFDTIDDAKGPFSEDIKQLMDAVGKGFSILEIVWMLKESGRWKGKYMVKELVFHKQKYWFFKDARWHKSNKSVVLYGDQSFTGKPVPWTKLIHWAFDAEDNLYGQAAFKPAYWYSWFKREGWKSWIVFLNKYATPTATGKYPENTAPAKKALLMAALNSIQEETAIIYPDTMDISFLESGQTAAVSYKELSDACNAEMSKAILGATQTVEEGRRGSYALSRAHSEVRRERVMADTVEISDIIQQQLVKRIVDYNWETERYPQFVMRKPAGALSAPTGTRKVEQAPAIPTQPVELAKPIAPAEPAIPGLATPGLATPGPATPEPEVLPEGSPEGPPEGLVELPPADGTASPETSAEIHQLLASLRQGFGQVQESVEKNYEKKPDRVPVVNVGAIKSALVDSYDEHLAFSLAGKVKAYIESRINPENIDKIFSEAFEGLEQELKRVTDATA